MLELDHVFIFTATGAPEAAALIAIGLEEGPGNRHPGQGTSNRRFFFKQNFLELLWVHDEDEIRTPLVAPTHLWERSRWQQTGYSPFGLCVRPSGPNLTEDEPVALPQTWAYMPPYLPDGLSIAVADNGSVRHEPMLFQIPSVRRPDGDGVPKIKRQPHPMGVRTITKLIWQTPERQDTSAAMTQLLKTDWLFYEPRKETHLTLEFDHGTRRQCVDFSPQLPLTISW